MFSSSEVPKLTEEGSLEDTFASPCQSQALYLMSVEFKLLSRKERVSISMRTLSCRILGFPSVLWSEICQCDELVLCSILTFLDTEYNHDDGGTIKQ